MKKVRIGINGFGRIGRCAARIILARDDLELAAINSRADSTSHAYLLTYDSIHGTFPHKAVAKDNLIEVKNQKVMCFQSSEPKDIPWKEAGVAIVIEASGKFTKRTEAAGHLKDSVKKVVISAPSADADITIVLGVNEGQYNPKTHHIISNASCTTNCTAIVAKVLNDALAIKHAMMTTVHATTQSQSILDASSKKDKRGGRSALNNIIPATTGASHAVTQVLPELKGKLSALSLRVPIPDGSIIDFVAEVEKSTTVEEVNTLFTDAAQGALKGIVVVASDELVSSDIIHTPYSAIFDPYLTSVLGGNLVKVLAWYDNEWGYATRLVELLSYLAHTL